MTVWCLWRGDARREAAQQRERIHVDGHRAVGEGSLQDDADEAVGKRNDTLVRERWAQDVAEQGLAPVDVEPARAGGSVEGEPVE